MTLILELTLEQEARLLAAARQEGLEPAEMVTKLVAEHLPSLLPENEQARRTRVMQELVEETERLGLYQ